MVVPAQKRFLDLLLTIASVTSGCFCIGCVGALVEEEVIYRHEILGFLSIACPFVNILMYVSPIPALLEALRTRSGKALPVTGFWMQATCNILALSYGLQVKSMAVLATNMFGLGCQVLFLACAHDLQAENTFAKLSWMSFSALLSLALNAALYVFATLAPLGLLGHAITIVNILLFAAPLGKVGLILRSRDSSPLDPGMTFIALVNNALWSTLGLVIQDNVLFLPSILGYLLSALQVMVILWCKGLLFWDLDFMLLLGNSSTQCWDAWSKAKVDSDEEMEMAARTAPELTPDHSWSPSAMGKKCQDI